MRAALGRLPDGDAGFADIFDGDGVLAPGATQDEPFTVRLTIRKQGDAITADFAGSDPRGAGADERAADRDRFGCVLRAEDDRRPEKPDPAEFGLLAAGHRDRAPGSVVNAEPPVAGRLRQSRDIAPGCRHGYGGNGDDRARHGYGRLAGHLGGHHVRRTRPTERENAMSATSR